MNSITLSQITNVISLYTGGSVYLDQVGVAFIVLKNNGGNKKEVNMACQKTIEYSPLNIFLKALEYILGTRDEHPCNIYTDCLSVLRELANLNN